jgi:hypothetical protein
MRDGDYHLQPARLQNALGICEAVLQVDAAGGVGGAGTGAACHEEVLVVVESQGPGLEAGVVEALRGRQGGQRAQCQAGEAESHSCSRPLRRRYTDVTRRCCIYSTSCICALDRGAVAHYASKTE